MIMFPKSYRIADKPAQALHALDDLSGPGLISFDIEF